MGRPQAERHTPVLFVCFGLVYASFATERALLAQRADICLTLKVILRLPLWAKWMQQLDEHKMKKQCVAPAIPLCNHSRVRKLPHCPERRVVGARSLSSVVVVSSSHRGLQSEEVSCSSNYVDDLSDCSYFSVVSKHFHAGPTNSQLVVPNFSCK